jgi:hypothetical protein
LASDGHSQPPANGYLFRSASGMQELHCRWPMVLPLLRCAESATTFGAFTGDVCWSGRMKVIDGLKGIEPGQIVSVEQLGLPASGRNGLLLVFWKST